MTIAGHDLIEYHAEIYTGYYYSSLRGPSLQENRNKIKNPLLCINRVYAVAKGACPVLKAKITTGNRLLSPNEIQSIGFANEDIENDQ